MATLTYSDVKCPNCGRCVTTAELAAYHRCEDCAIYGGPVSAALHDQRMRRINIEVEARMKTMPERGWERQ